MEETTASLVDYLNIAKRRRMHMLIAFVVIMLLAVLLAFGLPAKYRSSALIMIEGQDIPEDLVRSTITSYADERVQRITQRAMTSVNLSRIIDEHGLYEDDIERIPRSEIIEEMREDIHIDLVAADVIDPRSGRPTKATIAFSIAFDYENPTKAQKVANELVTLYREVNLTESSSQVEGAAEFLGELMQTHSTQVLALEERLTELKLKNGGALPEFMDSNLKIMQSLQRDMAQTESRLQAVKNRMIFLEAQLMQTDPNMPGALDAGAITSPQQAVAIIENELRIAKSQYGANHPDVRRYERMIAELTGGSGGQARIDQIDVELANARSELEVASGRYGPDHPEIKRLNRLVETLEGERTDAVASLLTVTVTPAPSIANEVNVREGPGTDTSIVGTLRKGQEATLIDSTDGNWYRIALPNGTQGYVSKKVAVQSSAAAAPAMQTADVPSNPAYITLQANYVQAQTEAESLVSLYRNLQQKVAEYQAVIDRTPLVEREYSALLRELTEARMRLAESTAKAEEARIGVMVVNEGKAQAFNLLEPPIAPTEPHWPNRWALLFLGFVLSLFGTLAAAAAAENMDNSVRTAKDIMALAGAPPLAAIPIILTADEGKKSRRGLWIVLGVLAALLAIVLLIIHLFVKPLDVAWFALLRKLGL